MTQPDSLKSNDDIDLRQDNLAVEGLYLHIPYCFHKCHYCDFYSLALPADPAQADPQAFTPFIDALVRQLEALVDRHRPRPRTVFVGGGTPTLMPPQAWQRLLAAMAGLGLLDHIEEFTVEANPETVTPRLVQVLADGGVNRASIGCQSFDPDLLQQLERWHDPRNVQRAMEIFRGAGISNLNLDLIFAIPTQTPAQLDADLDQALALQPTHVSYYSLIFEPNTPLTRKLKLGRISRVGEDVERAMYERVIDRLAAAGYEHYEISNWCRPARACRHNLLYWHSRNWLAAGPSASGHLDGYRWKIAPRLGDYIARSPAPDLVDEERLPPRARRGEQLMMRIRLLEGVPLELIPGDVDLAELFERRLLQRTATHLRLTREGLMFADTVAARLL